jgi:hypothetical protein
MGRCWRWNAPCSFLRGGLAPTHESTSPAQPSPVSGSGTPSVGVCFKHYVVQMVEQSLWGKDGEGCRCATRLGRVCRFISRTATLGTLPLRQSGRTCTRVLPNRAPSSSWRADPQFTQKWAKLREKPFQTRLLSLFRLEIINFGALFRRVLKAVPTDPNDAARSVDGRRTSS